MKKLFLLFLLLSSILTIKAENQPSDPVKGCMTYNTKEETFYYVEKGVELDIAEQMKYRSLIVLSRVSKCGDRTEITILNPKDVYEPWMEQNVTTVIDKDGVLFLDEDGVKVHSYEPEELPEDIKKDGSEKGEQDMIWEFDEKLYEIAKKNNAKVERTDLGYVMKGDDFILEVNSKEKITKLKFLKDGIETGYEKTHYQGDSNDTLPKVKVLSFTKTEPNGKKIERVTVTTFSEYQLN